MQWQAVSGKLPASGRSSGRAHMPVERESMKTRSVFAVTLAAMAVSVMSMQVRAGGDKIAFPENFAQGAMYTTLDRADNKQYRERCFTPAATEADRKGQPLPSGTVITIVQYKAQVDAQGNPVK